MNILVVDDEPIALNGLVSMLKRIVPEAQILSFSSPSRALQLLESTPFDILFLDIQMAELSGVQLARQAKAYYPNVNIIFTTAYSEYALDALDLRVSGYLMKPISEKRLRKELDNLRYPLQETPEQTLLTVRTFGNFEVFCNDEPIHFQYTKSKELLAYLVDRRGSMSDNGEIISVLWDEDIDPEKKKSYLKNIRRDLIVTLEKYGFENVIIHQRNLTGINVEKVNCDFYLWLEEKHSLFSTYLGEYMQQYSWGEVTHGQIARINAAREAQATD